MKVKGGLARKSERILKRWRAPDYVGGTERFQIKLLMRDIGIFVAVPLGAVVFYKAAEGIAGSSQTSSAQSDEAAIVSSNDQKSQILRFSSIRKGFGGAQLTKRSPGTLVRLRLLNSVESLDGASAHARVLDSSLGARFTGGVVVGDVVSDPTTNRIALNFRFLRDPKNASVAFPIMARAMSLDGTAGIAAYKKEGFFARAALRSGASGNAKADGDASPQDFRTMVAKAVAAGVMQEFQSEAGVASKRSQVLMLQPGTEFFAELTDYFPASTQ